MNNRSWRGTILFTVILVVMGGTVGLKLYGLGAAGTSALTSIHSTTTPSGPQAASGIPGSPSTPSAAAATPPASSAPPPASTAARVITGSTVDTRYGAVQVKVTFSGSTITAVDTLKAPDRGGRDIEISQAAIPVLTQEVLASQSANIDSVSGATYTSEGYRQSVQSAIDQR